MSKTSSFEIDRVSKRYGDVVALDDMTFDVRPGELFGFVGSNGAGKTTTMRIALGVLAQTRERCAGAARRSTSRPAAGSVTCQRSAGSIRRWPCASNSSTSRGCTAFVPRPTTGRSGSASRSDVPTRSRS